VWQCAQHMSSRPARSLRCPTDRIASRGDPGEGGKSGLPARMAHPLHGPAGHRDPCNCPAAAGQPGVSGAAPRAEGTLLKEASIRPTEFRRGVAPLALASCLLPCSLTLSIGAAAAAAAAVTSTCWVDHQTHPPCILAASDMAQQRPLPPAILIRSAAPL
jgi:hypothetical protein